jgi:tRNA (guanine6-N2)-methyltransferase
VTRFVLRSLSGLEPVVVAEVLLRFHHKARWIGPRELVVEVSEEMSAATAEQLVQLATVDDAFLELATSAPVSKTKAGLTEILAMLDDVEARSAARLVLDWRGVSWPEELWVTASVLGGRRYSRFDVEDAAGPVLAAKVGVAYRSQREMSRTEFPALAFRLTVDQRRNALLLRLAHRPLHRRSYWRQARRGALYPPLAAAMSMLADLQPGNVVLDPFCGAGTIPIEINRLAGDRVSVIASDIAHDATIATRENAFAASAIRIGLFRADVSWMPIVAHSIDRIVANPPWNRQVTWLGRDAGAQFNEMLIEEGRVVLLELAPDAERLGRLQWAALATLPVSLRGQHPVITVYGPERRPVAVGIGDGRSIPLHEVTRTLLPDQLC